jgi:hypothetical protein
VQSVCEELFSGRTSLWKPKHETDTFLDLG